ncbi:MAG: MFS transporter [Lactobacillales bacterium]|jgi:DHA1 family tetracycline resistance protein-like MFS transporter|nr:MFS transporter [Lactobacillales bacterium]
MNTTTTEEAVDKHALVFGLISAFLCGLGFTVVAPVLPFLVKPYVSSDSQQALMVTFLVSVYAFCVFFAAPAFGALSDKFGRRPILIFCLLGSSLGYLTFGIGGALWVLFVGRIIEGITAGEIGTIFAYFADIIPASQRTKYFGWLSATVGLATIMGPSIGGLLAHFDNRLPLFAGAVVTLINALYGLFLMPESLAKDKRLDSIEISRLNPFSQLVKLLSMRNISYLLLSGFLVWLPNGSLQAICPQLSLDTFAWKPIMIGILFSVMGIQTIFSQAVIMPRLLKRFNDQQIARIGLSAGVIGYALLGVATLAVQPVLFFVGIFVFAFSNAIFGPAFNGMLSKSVSASEQGRVQGGSQAIQALALMFGPLLGGQLYILISHSAPSFTGAILVLIAIIILAKKA